MKRYRPFRAVYGPMVAYAVLAGAASSVGGCIVPPVLAPVTDWGGHPDRRSAAETIELALQDGTALAGLIELAEPGAPLVLHFFESGGGVVPSVWFDERYDRLADLGLSSMAVDYRGIGLSGGSRAPRRMLDDARQLYRHAVERVGGDEGRVILRATSLGTTLVAGLLEGGARPRAVVAFAPVESATLARRFAAQHWWGFLYWPIAPFLQQLVDVSTLDQLGAAPCPVLVVTDPDDCFMSAGEVARLQAVASTRETLDVVIPDVKTVSSQVSVSGFQRHMSVVRGAEGLQPFEQRFLIAFGVEGDVIEGRVQALLERLPHDVAARIRADDGALARLQRILLEDRYVFPEAAAAAAIQLRDDEVESGLSWISSRWLRFPAVWNPRSFDPLAVEAPRTFDEFLGVFDLRNGEGGRWPIGDILTARDLLRSPSAKAGGWVWSESNVRALALSLEGEIEEAQAHAESARESEVERLGVSNASWLELAKSEGDFLTVKLVNDGGSTSRSVFPARFFAKLTSTPDGRTRREVALALLRKAAWLP
ncbi:MAG: alpha/beta hydrolase [Planctomycetota bacterium]